MLTGIIVDDEKNDAADLQKHLTGIRPDLSCTIFSTGSEALKYVKKQNKPIDIFFISRELSDMGGFSLASRIRQMLEYTLTPLVFVTESEKGKEAFQGEHCCSCLLKPASEKSIKNSIGTLLETLRQQKKERKLKRIISLKIEGSSRLVEAQSILGLETAGKDCYVYVGKNKYRILRQTLDKILKEIDDPYCIRCHQSFAVNVRNMIDLKKARRDIWVPVFSQDAEFQCEISKTYYDEVMKGFHKYLSGKA